MLNDTIKNITKFALVFFLLSQGCKKPEAVLPPETNLILAHDSLADLRHWETASPDPDRIFLSFCGNPATSRAVTWRTDTSISTATAQIAKSTANPNFHKAAITIEARTETVDINKSDRNIQGEFNYHTVVFYTLEPDTLYA